MKLQVMRLVAVAVCLVVSATHGQDLPSRPSDAPPTTEARPSDLLPAGSVQDPYAGPKAVKRQLDTFASRAKASLDHFQSREWDLSRIEDRKLAAAELIVAIAPLEKEADDIISAFDQAKLDFDLYLQVVERAPAAYEELEKKFTLLAAEEPEPLLAKGFADMAAASKALARYYVAEKTRLHDAFSGVTAKMTVVTRSKIFFSHLKQFLQAIPVDGGPELEAYVDRVNAYVELLQQAINVVQGFSEQLSKPQTRESNPKASVPSPVAPGVGPIQSGRSGKIGAVQSSASQEIAVAPIPSRSTPAPQRSQKALEAMDYAQIRQRLLALKK